MEVHDLCKMFPAMSKAEFDELCEDIKKHGIIERIVIYEGKILDGRNRYNASKVLDCDIYDEEWNGQCGSPLAFVVAKNLHRRSLTPGQRAAIALDVKDRLNTEYEAKRNAGKKPQPKPDEPFNNFVKRSNAQKEAAAMMGVSQGYVSDAGRIRSAAPSVFDEVKQGKKTIPQAKRELAEKNKPAKKEPSSLDAGDLNPDPLTLFSEKSIAVLGAMKKEFKQYDIAGDVLSKIDGLVLAIKILSV